MAAEATGEHEVADVFGVCFPGDVHVGEEVSVVDFPEGVDGVLDVVGACFGDLGVLRLVEGRDV